MWYVTGVDDTVSCLAFFDNEVEDSNDPFILPQPTPIRDSPVLPRQTFEQHFDGLVTIGVSIALFLPLAAEMIVSSGSFSCLFSLSAGGVDD